MKVQELYEAKAPKVPPVYLVIKLELEYIDRRDNTKRGNVSLAVICPDEERAKELQGRLDAIEWSEDHDDLLHHMGSNGFTNFEHGYVDAIPLSSKIATAEPKSSARTFFANYSDFK
jgi:hypothetical protein